MATPSNLRQFEHLTTPPGADQERIFAILQDERGFLWFTTTRGLARYDGTSYRWFSPDASPREEMPEAKGPELSALLETSAQAIWVGTWSDGLLRFDPEREMFRAYHHDPNDEHSLSGQQISALHRDRKGFLWIGTFGHGLNRFDPRTQRFERFRHSPEDPNSLSHDYIWSIASDGEGRIWVGTDAGLDRLNPDGESFRRFDVSRARTSGSGHNRVRVLYLDHSNVLWIGSDAGMRTLAPGSDRPRALPPAIPLSRDGFDFTSILEDPDRRIWIGTMNRGLFLFDRTTGRLTNFAHDSEQIGSLPHNDVRTLFIDRSNNLWVGTHGGGIARLDLKPVKFQLYRPEAGTSDSGGNKVWAIQEGSEGSLWVGTDNGLARFDRRREHIDRLRYDSKNPDSPCEGQVRALREDQRGTLWVGTSQGGLCQLMRDGKFHRYMHRDFTEGSLSHDSVTSIYETEAGQLWIGTDGGGLNRFDRNEARFTAFRHDPTDPNSLSHDRVTAILEDDRKALWVGTNEGGLNRFFPYESQFRHYRRNPDDPRSLDDDRILSLHQDRTGILWIGTREGLNRFESFDESFTKITIDPERQEIAVLGILEDDEGRLWLTTDRGLRRYSAATGQIRPYSLQDGLQGTVFSPGAAFRSSTGEMFVGGPNGLNTFYPKQIADNPFPPRLVLSDLRIFDQRIELGNPHWTQRQLHFSFRDSLISFDFAVLDFTDPQRNRISYRLEEADADWQEAPGLRITFKDLPSGSHRLLVRAANNDGVWAAEPLALDLEVTAPTWKTWWFRTSAITSLGLLLLWLGAYRYRTLLFQRRNVELENLVASRTSDLRERSEQLEGAYEELRRFAYLASHDLRTPLVTMRGFIGELQSTLKTVREAVQPSFRHLTEVQARHLDTALNEDIAEALSFIDSAANRMAVHNQALLELARLGGRELEIQKIDLEKLVREIVESLKARIREDGVEVKIGALPEVAADRFFLGRILQNLLTNALDSLEPGRLGSISVTAEREDSKTMIHIRDNGRGMPERDIPTIFDSFQGVRNSDGEGTGLAYVQVMVRQLRGRVHCTSKVGEGSTFSFSISNNL